MAVAETWLLADIGGTKSRFALQRRGGDIGEVTVLYNRDHPSLAAAAEYFLGSQPHSAPLAAAAISVASPIGGFRGGDVVTLTNYDWTFSLADLKGQLGVDHLRVINDFAAIAHGVPSLGPTDLRQIGGGEPQPEAPRGVIGPGNGLGESSLIGSEQVLTVLACEGGHVTLAE